MKILVSTDKFKGSLTDILHGNPLKNYRICRTFSDCTTAPRNGMVSGCYPLDDYYKSRPEYSRLSQLKRCNQ